MKHYNLICSKDEINVDFEMVIESETEPDYWTCYNIAEKHNCPYFYLDELDWYSNIYYRYMIFNYIYSNFYYKSIVKITKQKDINIINIEIINKP